MFFTTYEKVNIIILEYYQTDSWHGPLDEPLLKSVLTKLVRGTQTVRDGWKVVFFGVKHSRKIQRIFQLLAVMINEECVYRLHYSSYGILPTQLTDTE